MARPIDSLDRTHAHPVSGRGYVLTWLALLLLTATSFVTTVIELNVTAETLIMLLIATIKATLVALVFMHLIEERFANRVTLGTALVFVALLCSLMVADVATRTTVPPKAQPRPAATR